MNLINEIQPAKSRVPTLVVVDDEEYILSTLKVCSEKKDIKCISFHLRS